MQNGGADLMGDVGGRAGEKKQKKALIRSGTSNVKFIGHGTHGPADEQTKWGVQQVGDACMASTALSQKCVAQTGNPLGVWGRGTSSIYTKKLNKKDLASSQKVLPRTHPNPTHHARQCAMADA